MEKTKKESSMFDVAYISVSHNMYLTLNFGWRFKLDLPDVFVSTFGLINFGSRLTVSTCRTTVIYLVYRYPEFFVNLQPLMLLS